MPHFYFVVHDEAGEAPDSEGAFLSGVEAALLHAAEGARSMMCDSMKLTGTLELDAFIRIEDADRIQVARLSFADAINM